LTVISEYSVLISQALQSLDGDSTLLIFELGVDLDNLPVVFLLVDDLLGLDLDGGEFLELEALLTGDIGIGTTSGVDLLGVALAGEDLAGVPLFGVLDLEGGLGEVDSRLLRVLDLKLLLEDLKESLFSFNISAFGEFIFNTGVLLLALLGEFGVLLRAILSAPFDRLVLLAIFY